MKYHYEAVPVLFNILLCHWRPVNSYQNYNILSDLFLYFFNIFYTIFVGIKKI